MIAPTSAPNTRARRAGEPATGALAPDLLTIADAWDAKAADLEPFAPPAAVAYRDAASTLRAALTDAAAAVLTLEQAAAESGMHRDTLRHLVADGTIPNAGRRGAPRIRRSDLPRKPAKSRAPRASAEGFDVDAFAMRVVGGAGRG